MLKLWALAPVLFSLLSTSLAPSFAYASEVSPEVDDLKLLASCIGRDAENRFGPNRALLAEQLRKLGVHLSEDPKSPFFDDLSLALLLRHFRQAKPEQPTILAAPQGKWLEQDNPELASPLSLKDLQTPLPKTLPRASVSKSKIVVLGRNAFDGSLKKTIEDLQAAYVKHPEIFADPKNTLTFDFENSLTQRINALTLSPEAYKTKLIKTYQVEFPDKEWSVVVGLRTTPLKESEIKAFDAILQDLPQQWAKRAFKRLKIVRAQDGISLPIPSAVAIYNPFRHEIIVSDKAFQDSRVAGKNTLTHELGHAVAEALRKSDPTTLDAFFQISWRERTAVSPKGFVSSYSRENPSEDFAETFAAFARDSAELKKKAPLKYEWMKKYLFADREYFPIYPKNAQIEISSHCEDDTPPAFAEALNLRQAIELSCEVDPSNPDLARIVARVSGLTDEGVGIDLENYKTIIRLEDTPASSVGAKSALSSYNQQLKMLPNGQIEFTTAAFSLSGLRPGTEFRVSDLDVVDRAGNLLSWGDYAAQWNAPEQKLVKPRDLFAVSVPGKATQVTELTQDQLRPISVSSDATDIWIVLPTAAIPNDCIALDFSEKSHPALRWTDVISQSNARSQILPDASNPALSRVRIPRPRLPNGTYFLNRVNFYQKSGKSQPIAIGQDPQLSFVIEDGTEPPSLRALPETLALQEIKSSAPNASQGDTTISVKVSLDQLPKQPGLLFVRLKDPKQQTITCSGDFAAGRATEIKFDCPLPIGHLAGTYSVEEITTRQSLGGNAAWSEDVSLVRQGIRKTIQVKDLKADPAPKKQEPVLMQPEL